jgi:hypothetical protein
MTCCRAANPAQQLVDSGLGEVDRERRQLPAGSVSIGPVDRRLMRLSAGPEVPWAGCWEKGGRGEITWRWVECLDEIGVTVEVPRLHE